MFVCLIVVVVFEIELFCVVDSATEDVDVVDVRKRQVGFIDTRVVCDMDVFMFACVIPVMLLEPEFNFVVDSVSHVVDVVDERQLVVVVPEFKLVLDVDSIAVFVEIVVV